MLLLYACSSQAHAPSQAIVLQSDEIGSSRPASGLSL
jgi:hypothetical protein